MQYQSLNDLARELVRQKEARADFVADTRQVRITTNGQSLLDIMDLAGDDGGFPILPHAHGQIAARLDIPKGFYDRLRGADRTQGYPAIFDGLVNGLLTAKPDTRLVRVLDNKVRAYLSNRYRMLDHIDLVEQAVLPAFRDIDTEVEIQRLTLTPERLHIAWSVPAFQDQVRPFSVGDTVAWGGVISNSEVGSGKLNVETRIFKLSCTNGMVSGSLLDKRHIGGKLEESEETYQVFSDETLALDDAAFFAKARDVVKSSVDRTAFDRIIAQLRPLTEEAIVSPVQATERLAEKLDLAVSEKDSILAHLAADGDLTSWGLVNAITRTAQDVDDDRGFELERLAGEWALAPAAERRTVLVAQATLV